MSHPKSAAVAEFSDRVAACVGATIDFVELVKVSGSDAEPIDRNAAVRQRRRLGRHLDQRFTKLLHLLNQVTDDSWLEDEIGKSPSGPAFIWVLRAMDFVCPPRNQVDEHVPSTAHEASVRLAQAVVETWDKWPTQAVETWIIERYGGSGQEADSSEHMLSRVYGFLDAHICKPSPPLELLRDLQPVIVAERDAMVRALDSALTVGIGMPRSSETRSGADTKLNRTDVQLANYIAANPGSKGATIAASVPITPEHFRSKIFPKLRRLGFWNDNNRDGYFAPQNWKKPT